MISRIFIDRPIFAWVIAIVIMLAGAGSIVLLPIEQYPDIAPPIGVFPLAISTGAGAMSRVAIGTSVLGGMVAATVLAIYYVPLFFVALRRLFHGKRLQSATDVEARPPHAGVQGEAT
jgi:multidrug efflux pump subunit AcrB